MEGARRIRGLIVQAKDLVEQGGDKQEALGAMREAVDLLRKMEAEMTRFRDLLVR